MIQIPLISLLLIGCVDSVKKTTLDEFYIEVITTKPLNNILIEVSHFGISECIKNWSPVHGKGNSHKIDYYSTKLISSNKKIQFKGGVLGTGCNNTYGDRNSIDITLTHPEIDEVVNIYPEGIRHTKRININGLMVNKGVKIIANSNKIDSCSENDTFCFLTNKIKHQQFFGLFNYIKHISGGESKTAFIFKDIEIDIEKIITPYIDIISKHPALNDIERFYLLDKLISGLIPAINFHSREEQFYEYNYFLKNPSLGLPESVYKLLFDEKKLIQSRLRESFISEDFEHEMVAIPSGSFEHKNRSGDRSAHQINIKPFFMSKYEVSMDQWYACIILGGCKELYIHNIQSYSNQKLTGDYRDNSRWNDPQEYLKWLVTPSNRKQNRNSKAMTNLSWNNIQEYLVWLNKQTGKKYRLPTEAEWNYVARNEGGKEVYSEEYKANDYGIYDLDNKIDEWTQDCVNPNYRSAPVDGSAWLSKDCYTHVIRGYGRYRYYSSDMDNKRPIGVRFAMDM